jgi:hypothetical protein
MRLKLNREMWLMIPRVLRNKIVNRIKFPYPKTVFEAYPCYEDLVSLACKEDGQLQEALRQWVRENAVEIMKAFTEASAKAKASVVVSDQRLETRRI